MKRAILMLSFVAAAMFSSTASEAKAPTKETFLVTQRPMADTIPVQGQEDEFLRNYTEEEQRAIELVLDGQDTDADPCHYHANGPFPPSRCCVVHKRHWLVIVISIWWFREKGGE